MARIPITIASRGLETGPMVNYSGVSRSPVGQALQGFGGELQGMSSQLAAIEERRRSQREEVENFEAMQQLDRMELAVQGDLAQVQQNTPASGMGYHDNALTTFEKKQQEFLANVPERLKPRLSSILETKRMEFSQKQAQAELELRQGWYRDGVKEKQESLQNQVFNDPTTFANAREEGLLAIEASGLPEIEKTALREGWDETLALTLGEREVRDAEANPDSANDVADRLGVRGATGSQVEQFVDRIIQVESGGRSNAKNPNSTATGPGQFINSTWLATVKKYRPDITQGRSDAQILSLRSDQALSREMTTAYAQENANFLANQGVEGTAGNIYLAHFLGPRGAAQVLKAAPGTPIVNIVGNEVVRANGFLRGKTAADVIAWSDKKMGGSGSVAGGQPTDPRYASLPLDKRLEIFDRTNAAAARGRTAFAAQEKAAYDSYKGSLELGIETGQIASERTILSDPMLTDAHKADLLASFKTKMADQLATQQAVAAFSQGALVVDPYSTDGRKAVDNVWKALSENAGPEQAQASLDSLVQQTGTVPQGVINLLRRGLTSQNPTDIANAAQTASRISAIDSAALGRRDGGTEVQKAADDFGFYVNTLNLPPEEAAQRMADANKPERQLQRKALEPAAKEFKKELEGEDLASVFSGGFFSSNPDLGFGPGQALGIQAEFMAIAEDQFYAANGDPEIAKNRAMEEMKRLYGVSTVTGRNVVMKHPPDKYWPTMRISDAYGRTSFVGREESMDYAMVQLRDDLKTIYPDVDMSRVQFVTTPETDAMVKRGEMPAYAVLYQDADGVLQTIPGRLWRPDFDAARERVAPVIEREQERDIERARDMQGVYEGEAVRQDLLQQRQTETGQRLRGEPVQPTQLPALTVTPEEGYRDQMQDMREEFEAGR